MKPNPSCPVIKLIDLLTNGSDTAFGNAEGRAVFQKLAAAVDSHYDSRVIGISLEGITRTDASFPRESVISFVKAKMQEKGFYLFGFRNQDLLDNWDYAAKAKSLNLIVLTEDSYQLIGPPVNHGTKELLDFVFKEGSTTTSKVASAFDLTPQNASGRLKKLYNQGLILGYKESASTGGVEYVFQAIR